jgi:hypothetical protein
MALYVLTLSRRTLERMANGRHLGNFLQTARAYAQEAYDGKRLKFVPGPYMTHAEAVAARVRTTPAKALALLHDVIEIKVKDALRAGKDLPPVRNSQILEELLIARELEKVETFFAERGFNFAPLTPHLDALTHRKIVPYDDYIKSLANHARATGSTLVIEVKIGDLEENKDPGRNPRGTMLTAQDRERLAKYERALAFFRQEFPDVVTLARKGQAATVADVKRRKNSAPRPPRRRLGKQQRLNLALD